MEHQLDLIHQQFNGLTQSISDEKQRTAQYDQQVDHLLNFKMGLEQQVGRGLGVGVGVGMGVGLSRLRGGGATSGLGIDTGGRVKDNCEHVICDQINAIKSELDTAYSELQIAQDRNIEYESIHHELQHRLDVMTEAKRTKGEVT